MKRTDERNEFLTDILCIAIENGGTGWFYTSEYKWDVPLGEAFAVIEPEDEPGTEHRVDLDVIARGLRVIRDAKPAEITESSGTHLVLHNVATGQRLYMGSDHRGRILQADRENEAGDLDAIDALAIVECALFGAVTYC